MKSERDSIPMLDEPTITTCLILLSDYVEGTQGLKKMAEHDLLLCEALEVGVALAKKKVMQAAKVAHIAELALENMKAYAKAADIFAEEGG